MSTRNASELMSLPVIATQQGREIGRVKDVLFDPNAHQLLGLMVTAAAAAESTMFLERDAIRSIGDDAVTVDSDDKLGAVASYPRVREIIDSGIHLKGAPVLTESGESLGRVDKIMVDEAGGVAAYEVSRGVLGLGGRKEIAPADVISIGEDAIIVSRAAAEDADQHDEGAAAAGEPASDDLSRPTGARLPASDGSAPRAPGDVQTTADHEDIRAWAEARAGRPAEVRGSGVLRIAFDGSDDHLEPLSWPSFFEKFDASGCRFLHSTEPASNFYAFTST